MGRGGVIFAVRKVHGGAGIQGSRRTRRRVQNFTFQHSNLAHDLLSVSKLVDTHFSEVMIREFKQFSACNFLVEEKSLQLR